MVISSLLLGATVGAASTPERAGAQALLTPLLPVFTWLRRLWVVERTFAWLVQRRRLVRDCERTEASATAWIDVAMIRVMLRRLA